MAKGWLEDAEISEEETEKRRQEAVEQYQDKISSLKQEEIVLKASISDLKNTIEAANIVRISELNDVEEALKSKLSDAENLNIKLKNSIAYYERLTSEFTVNKNKFDMDYQEKEASINGILQDIELQKSAVVMREAVCLEKENELKIRLDECEKNDIILRDKIAVVDIKDGEIAVEKTKIEEDLLILRGKIKENDKMAQDALSAKCEYEAKYASLDGERQEIALLKSEYEEKINRINQEKLRQKDQALQLKSDRIILDKSIAEYKANYNDLKLQTERFNELKAQLSAT